MSKETLDQQLLKGLQGNLQRKSNTPVQMVVPVKSKKETELVGLHCTVTPDFRAELSIYAKRMRMTQGEVVEKAVNEYMEKNPHIK